MPLHWISNTFGAFLTAANLSELQHSIVYHNSLSFCCLHQTDISISMKPPLAPATFQHHHQFPSTSNHPAHLYCSHVTMRLTSAFAPTLLSLRGAMNAINLVCCASASIGTCARMNAHSQNTKNLVKRGIGSESIQGCCCVVPSPAMGAPYCAGNVRFIMALVCLRYSCHYLHMFPQQDGSDEST